MDDENNDQKKPLSDLIASSVETMRRRTVEHIEEQMQATRTALEIANPFGKPQASPEPVPKLSAKENMPEPPPLSRRELVKKLQATEGYTHSEFAEFADVAAYQYRDWARGRTKKANDQNIRSAASRWLKGQRCER